MADEFSIIQYLLENVPLIGVTIIFIVIIVRITNKQTEQSNKQAENLNERLKVVDERYISMIKEKDLAITEVSKQKDSIIEKSSERIIKYSEMFKDLSVILEQLHKDNTAKTDAMVDKVDDMRTRLTFIQKDIEDIKHGRK